VAKRKEQMSDAETVEEEIEAQAEVAERAEEVVAEAVAANGRKR